MWVEGVGKEGRAQLHDGFDEVNCFGLGFAHTFIDTRSSPLHLQAAVEATWKP